MKFATRLFLLSVPQLHQVLQPSTGIVLGPLWVTRGELFSSNGACKFLKTMLNDTKEKISQQEIFIREVNSLISDAP